MLLQHPHIGHGHAPVHGFAHVVDREQGDLHGGQGFHFHTGGADGFNRGGTNNSPIFAISRRIHCLISYKVNSNSGQRQRVAQRNQIAGFLRTLNARNPCNTQHIAFFGGARLNQRHGGGQHDDAALGYCYAVGGGFGGHVDHVGLALGVEMGQAGSVARRVLWGINAHERYHKAVKSTFIHLLLIFSLLVPNLSLGQSAKMTPLLGVGEDGDLSLGAERRMGDAIAKQIYRDPDYLDDPLLNEYVDGIWQSLLQAARAKGELSAEMDERFAWRVMLARDRTVNAFALPGGYFGVHLGLIGLVANRDELASVLAHELTHVTQRHISRAITQQGRQTPVMIAAMILGAVAARKSPDGVSAVIAGSQAVAIQGQLNFSRDMEREADRLGLGLMQPAGFAPQGFVAMFEKLQQSTRLSDSGNFPYLRSHPMTTERMGDMQQRLLIQESKTVKNTVVEPTLQHAMMSARARVLAEPGVDVLRLWAAEPQATGFTAMSKARQVASLYAAVLSNIKLRDFGRANEQKNKLKILVAGDLYAQYAAKLIAIEVNFTANDNAAALGLLDNNATAHRPSRPELFAQSQVQMASKDAKQASQAAQNLQTWVAKNPTDAPAWQLLARSNNAVGQPLRAIRADAEAQVALLDYTAALDRFKAAQDMVRNGSVTANAGRDYMEESIIDVRTRQVQELLKQQLKDEKDAKDK
jgi:predicted Zn-dependent protease